jgi:hypothetical protein
MRTESSAKLASAEHRAQLADATRQARSVRGAGAIDYLCSLHPVSDHSHSFHSVPGVSGDLDATCTSGV